MHYLNQKWDVVYKSNVQFGLSVQIIEYGTNMNCKSKVQMYILLSTI
jgi:hypothetical protein